MTLKNMVRRISLRKATEADAFDVFIRDVIAGLSNKAITTPKTARAWVKANVNKSSPAYRPMLRRVQIWARCT